MQQSQNKHPSKVDDKVVDSGGCFRQRKHSPLFINLLMLLSAFLVSTSFTVSSILAPQLDPLLLTFIRFVLASLFLAPYIWYKFGFSFPVTLIFKCAFISGNLVLFFWCMFLSLRYTTALNTSVIFTLVPSIAGVYAFFLLKERMSRQSLIALFCGLIGAIWILFKGDLSLLMELSWNKGDAIFFLGCLCMGFYTVFIKMMYKDEPMILMTFWILVTGSIWLFLFGIEKVIHHQWFSVDNNIWFWISYLAFFSTVVTFFITQYATIHLGSTRVVAFSYLYPSFVLILEFLLGKNIPQLSVLPGVIVVLIAMLVLVYDSSLQK